MAGRRNTVRGLPSLIMRFEKLDKAFGLGGERLYSTLLRAGKITRSHIRAGTPIGPPGRFYKKVPIIPGMLRRKIGVVKVRNTAHDRPGVRVHAFANHAWLVENGHIAQNGKHVGATHYFTNGVNRSAGIVKTLIRGDMEKMVNKAARL